LVTPAAVAATAAELVLGALLVAGLWRRWTGKAAAGLFAIYLVAMIPGMGAGSILQYGVPVLVGGALVFSLGRRDESTAADRLEPATDGHPAGMERLEHRISRGEGVTP
jgi:hypothetical protein